MTLYRGIDLDEITASVPEPMLTSEVFCGIHLRNILKEVLMDLLRNMHLELGLHFWDYNRISHGPMSWYYELCTCPMHIYGILNRLSLCLQYHNTKLCLSIISRHNADHTTSLPVNKLDRLFLYKKGQLQIKYHEIFWHWNVYHLQICMLMKTCGGL